MSNLLQSLIPFAAYPYRGQSIACNLCGSHEKTVICTKDRRWKPLRTVACSDCGLMRTDPMPTDEELEQYYRNEYRLDYQLAGTRPPKVHLVRSLRGAHNRAAALGDALKPGARVLDVGCGTGEFLKLAKDRGCEVVGIEPGKTYADFARSEYGLDVINGFWQEADLPEGGFDVVTCNQVVEHLRDPMAALAAMAQWLKPDGVAFISVPDMRPNQKPSFERFHFAHIYGFTPETLEAAMKCNGLVPASGEALETTTAVFKKAQDLDRASVVVRDPTRSQALAAGYPDDTIASYIFGGGYFRHAAHRFGKWRRDTFSKDKSKSA
jgi:SAM-dependent methyltransferase